MSLCRTPTALTWLSMVVCCTAAVCTPTWAAATVYRCGPIYQDKPCAGAEALTVDDSRDADQRAQAKAVAASEKRLAKSLADARREREKSARPQTQAAGIAPPTSAIPDAKPDTSADCGATGKSRAKSHKGKTNKPACGDAKVRYAVTPASP